MLDSRLTNIVKRRADHFEWLAHQSVRFHFSNEFSESLVTKRLNGILEKLDRINGAPVPDRVLIRGYQGRVNDIPVRDRVTIHGTVDPVEGDGQNPHLKALKEYDELHPTTEKTQRDKIKADAKAWQDEQDAKQVRVAMEADPAWRMRHVTAGEAYLLAHYTGVPESEFQLAAARLAAVNDPVKFAEADKAFRAAAEQRLAERDARIQVELGRLNAERDGLLAEKADPLAPPSAEAWELARKDATQLKHSGHFLHAAEEIETLYAGVHDGSIQPGEFHQRAEALREVSRAAG